MNNLYTSKMILYSGIEIKVPNGNGSEAKAQLFTWFQAGISRLRKLLKKIGNGTPATDPTLPLLGWTVIGERWELYMALGDGNGEADPITILGPFPTCQCITRNYPGAFGLLRLMEKIKDWAREVYWPWYCEAVIEPLKLVKDQPLTQEEETDKAVDVEEREALEEHWVLSIDGLRGLALGIEDIGLPMPAWMAATLIRTHNKDSDFSSLHRTWLIEIYIKSSATCVLSFIISGLGWWKPSLTAAFCQ